MKKKHRYISVNGKKYAWIVQNNFDGDGGNLVKIFYEKNIKFERLIPGHIILTPKYISQAIGGSWYTLLQEKVDNFVRQFYFEDYPVKLNYLWGLMNMNKSFAISEVREKLNIKESKENDFEIEKVIKDILQEESADCDDDYDDDEFEE